MTTVTVVVNSGACGYSVTIKAEKGKDGKITLSLATDCEMVTKMLEDIAVVDRFAALTGFQNNPVYRSASKHLKHAACVVPSAILKAIEVEAGLNVPKDAVIRFVKE
jgi:pentose-5-phosphate-3-epimerase